MYSLANQILDVYDDVFKDGMTKAAAKQPNLQVRSQDDLGGLLDKDFAINIITKTAQKLSKFPLRTPEDVWLSNEYFEQNHHKMPKLAAEIAALHIKKACDRKGVKASGAVEKLASTAGDVSSNYFFEEVNGIKPKPQLTKIAMDELAEASQIANNYSFAQGAMPTENHVKLANKYFDEYGSKMPLDIRHGYALSIQKRANELGMDPCQGEVQKYASDHYNGQIDAHLRSRMSLLECSPAVFKRTLEKMAAMKNVLPPNKFAKALHRFDKHAKLDKHYGSYLVDPYQATFAPAPRPDAAWLYKAASGKEVDAERLQEVAEKRYDKIASYFGAEIAKQLKEHPAQIFDSLPMDAKEIITGIANGAL
jgi:hypothetical protein